MYNYINVCLSVPVLKIQFVIHSGEDIVEELCILQHANALSPLKGTTCTARRKLLP